MTARKLGIVVAVACSISGTAEATTNLKPFDGDMPRLRAGSDHCNSIQPAMDME